MTFTPLATIASVALLFSITVLAKPVSPIVGVSAGGNNTCIWNADSVVKCWGRNFRNGLTKKFNGLIDLKVSAFHACALDRDGVWCWSESSDPGYTVPADIGKSRSIYVGQASSCVVNVSGRAQCWQFGTNDSKSWGGVGTNLGAVLDILPAGTFFLLLTKKGLFEASLFNFETVPVTRFSEADRLGTDRKFLALAPSNGRESPDRYNNIAQYFDPCALVSAKTDGYFLRRAVCYFPVPGLTEVRAPRAVANNDRFVCVIDSLAKVKCFERDSGIFATDLAEVPGDIRNAKTISLGYNHACVLDDEGVKCWGDDSNGQSLYYLNRTRGVTDDE